MVIFFGGGVGGRRGSGWGCWFFFSLQNFHVVVEKDRENNAEN